MSEMKRVLRLQDEYAAELAAERLDPAPTQPLPEHTRVMVSIEEAELERVEEWEEDSQDFWDEYEGRG